MISMTSPRDEAVVASKGIRMRRLNPVVFGSLALALGALGCGDGDSGGHEAEHNTNHHEGPGACGKVANCMDTVTLAEGLATEGEEGKFTLTVDAHTPLTTDNEWMVSLTDADGGAVADAKLNADVYSVDCMHGGPNPAEDVTTDAGGKATIHPVSIHGGPWDVIVKVESGSDTDTVTVHLCIPEPTDEDAGAEHSAHSAHDAD